MAYTYKNLRGDVYYLQQKTDSRRQDRYWLGRELTGSPLDQVPEGFEIFERPENAQPVVRKITPSRLLAQELELVRNAVMKQVGEGMARVEIEGRRGVEIVVYLSDADIDERLEMLHAIIPGVAPDPTAREWMMSRRTFNKMMRFTLENKERRLFAADRWCFLGSIDKWFRLDGGKPLDKLVAKYVKHLGKDSFFELI